MANNTLAASGFQDAYIVDGSAPTYPQRVMQIVSTLTSQIGFGDPVRQLATGYIDKYAAGGTTVTGVFKGCRYYSPAASRTVFSPAWTAPSLPAGTIVTAFVASNPDAVFQIQTNGAAIAQANIGQNIDITVGSSGAPNALSGISTCSVTTSSAATTGTLPFKIINIVGLTAGISTPAINPNMTPTNGNNWVEVVFNTNALNQTTGI